MRGRLPTLWTNCDIVASMEVRRLSSSSSPSKTQSGCKVWQLQWEPTPLVHALAQVAGDRYLRTVVSFWRTVRKQSMWLKPSALIRQCTFNQIPTHSAKTVGHSFYAALKSWRKRWTGRVNELGRVDTQCQPISESRDGPDNRHRSGGNLPRRGPRRLERDHRQWLRPVGEAAMSKQDQVHSGHQAVPPEKGFPLPA